VSAREVVREAAGLDPVACGRGSRLDVEWMNGVLEPLGGGACDFCGNPRVEVFFFPLHAYERDGDPSIVEVPLCRADAESIAATRGTR